MIILQLPPPSAAGWWGSKYCVIKARGDRNSFTGLLEPFHHLERRYWYQHRNLHRATLILMNPVAITFRPVHIPLFISLPPVVDYWETFFHAPDIDRLSKTTFGSRSRMDTAIIEDITRPSPRTKERPEVIPDTPSVRLL